MFRLFHKGDITELGLFLVGEAVVGLIIIAIGWAA